MFTLRPVKGENFTGREKLMEDMMFDLKNSFTGYALYEGFYVIEYHVFEKWLRRKINL